MAPLVCIMFPPLPLACVVEGATSPAAATCCPDDALGPQLHDQDFQRPRVCGLASLMPPQPPPALLKPHALFGLSHGSMCSWHRSVGLSWKTSVVYTPPPPPSLPYSPLPHLRCMRQPSLASSLPGEGFPSCFDCFGKLKTQRTPQKWFCLNPETCAWKDNGTKTGRRARSLALGGDPLLWGTGPKDADAQSVCHIPAATRSRGASGHEAAEY